MKLSFMKSTTRLAFLAGAALAASNANAAISVVAGGISTGSLVGQGLIIDTPTGTTNTADTGWAQLTGNSGQQSQLGWDPVDAVGGNANTGYGRWTVASGGNSPSTAWTFDLADGTIINAVYAVWTGNSNKGANYSYNEGGGVVTSAFFSHNNVSSTNDLVYQGWNFQKVIDGSITVAGGNGFAVTASGPTSYTSDAVIVDYTLAAVPEPSIALLSALGMLLLLRRRRCQ